VLHFVLSKRPFGGVPFSGSGTLGADVPEYDPSDGSISKILNNVFCVNSVVKTANRVTFEIGSINAKSRISRNPIDIVKRDRIDRDGIGKLLRRNLTTSARMHLETYRFKPITIQMFILAYQA
jgi:hypothetical protein